MVNTQLMWLSVFQVLQLINEEGMIEYYHSAILTEIIDLRKELVSAQSRQVSLVAQMVKNLPVMQETQVRSLGWEDPLEKGMATHSSILAWRTPWTGVLAGSSSWGCKELDTTEQLSLLHFSARSVKS